MLVLYASKTGNTRAIAEYISERTGSALIDLKKESKPNVFEHDVFVICSGVYAGKMSKRVRKFIDSNRPLLETKKVAIVLSCMFDGDKGGEQLDKIALDIPGLMGKAFYPGKQKGNDMSEIDPFINYLRSL